MPTTSMMNVILRHPRQEISRLQLPYFAGVVPRWLLENNSVVEYRGIVENEYGIGGVTHISLSLHQQQPTPIPSKCNLAPNFPTRIRSDPGRKRKENLTRSLPIVTTHDTRENKEKKSKPPWRCTSYLLPFTFFSYFLLFFLHMHACMPTEQKKAQDRKKEKKSNRNCKAGNLDTACRLPLQELINTCLPPVPVLYIAYLTFILFFSFRIFLFCFWGFRIDSRVPVPIPVPKLS